MKVDELLTYVERRSMEVDTKVTYPDKPQIMKYLSIGAVHLEFARGVGLSLGPCESDRNDRRRAESLHIAGGLRSQLHPVF